MLDKLLKYEFKAVGRIMIPLYIAWIIASLLLGLTLKIFSDFVLLNLISGALYTIITAAVVILSIVLLIQRFYKNLLGNEGYLTMTLPVTLGRHIWNKCISASVWIVFGCIFAFISAFVLFLTDGSADNFISGFKTLMAGMYDVLGGFTILLIVQWVIIALLVAGEWAVKIYAAIAVGHQANNHRVLCSFGAYLGFGFIEVIIANIFTKIFSVTNIELKFNNLMRTCGDKVQLEIITLMVFAVVAALFAIYYLITYKILQKKLNLQ